MHEKIGPALREARLERRLSLRSVATAAGISASLLSQVETGKSQPSVGTLYALVSHIGISLDELLGITGPGRGPGDQASQATAVQVVQRAADNPVLEMANGVRWERLAMGAEQHVDPLLVTYGPGAASSLDRKMMRHSGFEYAYLFEGELTLLLDFDRHVVRGGDSLCFDSTRPHLYVNQGDVPARGVFFVTGRHSVEPAQQQVSKLLGEQAAPDPSHLANAVEALDLLRGRTS